MAQFRSGLTEVGRRIGPLERRTRAGGDSQRLFALPINPNRGAVWFFFSLSFALSLLPLSPLAQEMDVNGDLKTSGKVGIGLGSSSLSDPLRVKGSGYLQVVIESENHGTGNAAGLNFIPQDQDSSHHSHHWELQAVPADASPANGFLIYDRTANRYRLVIDANGNVGIGTGTGTSTPSLLTVGDGGSSAFQVDSSGVITHATWSGGAISTTLGGTGGDSHAATGIAHVSSGAWSYGAVGLATGDISGTLPAASGGTGQTSYLNGQLLIGNGTGLTKATLTGSSNVSVTNDTGSITLNTSQDIHTTASPTFAAPVFSTSARTPLLIGGTGTTSNNVLTFKTTTGAGSGDYFVWKAGTDGGTERMRLDSSGLGTTLSFNVSKSGAGWSDWQQAGGSGWFSNLAAADDTIIRANTDNLILTAKNGSGAIRFGTGSGDTEKMTIASGGNVGIGATSPGDKFELNGIMRFDPVGSQPGATSGTGKIYAYGSGGSTSLYAYSGSGSITQFSSHADPRDVTSDTQTSFADPNIDLPFSFHHSNQILGRGAVVDLAKAVAYLEKKMQFELGAEEGRLVFEYTLPTSSTLTVAQWQQGAIEERTKEIMNRVSALPWIRVELGASGEVPTAAFVEVAETTKVQQTVSVTKKVMDFDAMRVVEVQEEQIQEIEVPTGRMKRQLADGWVLREDGLYRRPTLNDLNLDAILAEPLPGLPQWILDRIPTGGVNQTTASLTEKVRERLQAGVPVHGGSAAATSNVLAQSSKVQTSGKEVAAGGGS